MSKKFILLLLFPLLIIGSIYVLTFKIFLLIILPIISIFIHIIIRNTKLMNKWIEECLSIIKNNYKINKIDNGEFKKMSIYGIISFYTTTYHVEELGIISVMTFNIGLMQMIALTINPYEKDMPMLVYDIIYMFNKRVYIIEIFDLMLDKENIENKTFLNKIKEMNNKLSDYENYEVKKNWYLEILSFLIAKKAGKNHDQFFLNLILNIIKNYVEFSKKQKKLEKDDINKKISLIKNFGNDFIEKGGVSTDTFKRNFGVEKTRKFFAYAFYGYDLFKEIINQK